MSKLSDKDRQTLLDFNQPLPDGVGVKGIGFEDNDGLDSLINQRSQESNLNIINSIIKNPDEQQDTSEELILDDDNNLRRYQVTKDKQGNVLDKKLVKNIDAVKITDAEAALQQTGERVRQRFFNDISKSLNPLTDQPEPETKSFWGSLIDSNAMVQAGNLIVNSIQAGKNLLKGNNIFKDWDANRYGKGYEVSLGNKAVGSGFPILNFSQDGTINDLNKVSFQNDGAYYHDQQSGKNIKITYTPEETELLHQYVTTKGTYKAKNTGEMIAHMSLGFALDFPAYVVGGMVAGKVLGKFIPSLANVSGGLKQIPANLTSAFLTNEIMLNMVEAPQTIEHTREGGIDAFLEDQAHIAKFSALASVAHVSGDMVGTQFSKLLHSPKSLSMSESVTFLRRNPQIVKTLSGGFSSAALGYATGGESKEEKITNALLFASMHFANGDAFKSYVRGEQKNVMVDNASFEPIKTAMSKGKTLQEAIKDSRATIPDYYIREGQELSKIDFDKLTTRGEVVKLQESPIELNKTNIGGYKFITEATPYYVKTWRQSWQDVDRDNVIKNMKSRLDKDIENPYSKKDNPHEYENFEFNKHVTAEQLGDMIYSQKLARELKRNELPDDIKLKDFINHISDKLPLNPLEYNDYVTTDLVSYIKDPKGFEKESLLPKEFLTEHLKALELGKKAYESKAIELEIKNALSRVKTKPSTTGEEVASTVEQAKRKASTTEQTKLDPITKGEYDKFVKTGEVNPIRLEDIANKIKDSEKLSNEEQSIYNDKASEVEKILKTKPIESEKKPSEQPPVILEGKQEVPVSKDVLVDAKGNPLQSTEGAGLTAQERIAYNRPETNIKVLDKIETVNDLNTALEESKNPKQLIETISDYKNKRESIKYESNLKEIAEQSKQKRIERSQKLKEAYQTRKAEKLKTLEADAVKAGYDKAKLDQYAQKFLSPKEKAEYDKGNKVKFEKRIKERLVEDTKLPQEVKDAIKTINNKPLTSGIDPEQFKALVTYSKYQIKEGIKRFADYSKEMIRRFGEAVKPHLRRLWDATKRELKFIAQGGDPTSLNVFIGGSAKEFNRAQAKRAYIKGLEGKEKLWISDKDVKLADTPDKLFYKRTNKERLGDIITHTELYKNYPELKDVGIVYKDLGNNTVASANTNPFYNNIKLNERFVPYLTDKELKTTLLHEIQHFIQAKEGFARGANLGETDLVQPGVYEKLRNQLLKDKSQTQVLLNDKTFEDVGARDRLNTELRITDRILKTLEFLKENPKELSALLEDKDFAHDYRYLQSLRYKLSGGEIESKLVERLFNNPKEVKDFNEYNSVLDEYLKDKGLAKENIITKTEADDKKQGLVELEQLSADPERIKALRERIAKIKDEIKEPLKVETTKEEPTKIEGEFTDKEIEKSSDFQKASYKEKKRIRGILGKLEIYKPKKFKGRLRGTTLTPEEYDKLSDIRNVVRLDEKGLEDFRDNVVSQLEAVDKARRNGEIELEHAEESISHIEELIYRQSMFGNIKAKRGQELEDAYSELTELIKTGRTKHQALEEVRKQERDKDIKQFMNEIGVNPTDEMAFRNLDESNYKPSWLKRLGNSFQKYDTQNLGLEGLFRKASFKGNDSADKFFRMVKRSTRAEESGNLYWTGALENKLKEFYGKEGNELKKELTDNKEVKPTGIKIKPKELIKVDGKSSYKEGKKEIELISSQNELYKKWMEWRDPTLKPTMEVMGYNDTVIKKIGDYLKPEIKKWAEWQINEFYPEYYRSVNEVFKRMTFANLPFNKFYSPIERNVGAKKEDNQLLLYTSQYSTVFNHHLKSRVNSRAELKYLDGDAALTQHIAEMEHFKAWAESTRLLRGIFGDKTVRTAIEQSQSTGKDLIKTLDNHIDDLARGSIDRGKIVPLVDKVRNNFTRAVLGLNVTLIPKQLASFPAYAAEIPLKDFTSGVAEVLSNPMKAYREIKDSPFLQTRYKEGLDRDIVDALKKGTASKLSDATSLNDALYFAVKLGDKGAILLGGYPVYKYHLTEGLRKGLSPEEARSKALEEFEIASERSQQSGKIEDIPALMRAGSFGKLFTMFMSQPNQYYQHVSNAFRDFSRDKISGADATKRIAISHFILPMLFQFVADGFKLDAKHQFRAGLLGSLNGLLLIGDFLGNAVPALMNDFHFETQGTPVVDTFQDFEKSFSRLGKMIDENKFKSEDVLKAIDDLSSGTSKFVGIPYEPTKRIYTSATRSQEDGFQIDDILKIGYGSSVVKDLKTQLKESKRVMNLRLKEFRKDKSEDSRRVYQEAKEQYQDLVKKIKERDRKK